ncbi:XRE family transcriptional regulator [Streptomyces sp. NPDC020898]|uniref:XRE family transcriptional regulator n=1 Tax=Streptomyces sp. NPDC020898 TaxID=3365101 RepID=UPI0037B22A22
MALALGLLVDDRRTSLGLSQSAPGERLGTTADAVEALEPGGMLPVAADLLAWSAEALNATVNLHAAVYGINALTFGEWVA